MIIMLRILPCYNSTIGHGQHKCLADDTKDYDDDEAARHNGTIQAANINRHNATCVKFNCKCVYEWA